MSLKTIVAALVIGLTVVLLLQYTVPPAEAGLIVREGSGPPPPPPCSVSVSMTTSRLTYNGLPMNNPDGTYYPGDAFSVYLSVGSEYCTSVGTYISGDHGVSIACPGCTNTRVDISPSASPGTYTVSASVYGTGPGGSDYASTSLQVIVADPVITIRVTPANVTDSDGYLMRNADGTYYVNDAVALKYEVDYRFKDARRGVIVPEVTRVHPYPHIADLDCLQESCTLVVPGTPATSVYSAQYTYASGIAVANATGQQGPGSKEFRFDVRLKSAGVYTGMQKSYTYVVSVVDYRPVFTSVYQYLDLKDDAGSDMYGHRLVAGAHYLGSIDNSDGVIKPLRRAKVNYVDANVTAAVIGKGVEDITKDARLTLLYAEQYGSNSDPVLTSTAQGKTAMIEREGYVKFVSKMLGYVPDTEQWINVYNVTASQTFYSVNFGGKSSIELFSAGGYRYPENRFTTNYVTVNAVDENGYTVDRPVKITVNLTPPGDTDTTIMSMCDYYEKRALYSTGDRDIAMMARSDMYNCGGDGSSNNNIFTVTGTGAAYALVNATSIISPDEMPFYRAVYPGGIDTMPPDLVLSMPYYLSIKVSVGDVTKDYSVPLYDSGMSYAVSVVANVGQDNNLVVERDGYHVSVKPADVDSFGSISTLAVNNGSPVPCNMVTCIVDITTAGGAEVMATNMWGGVAKATVQAAPPGELKPSAGQAPMVLSDPGVLVMILMVAGGAVVAARLFKKWWSWTGDAFF